MWLDFAEIAWTSVLACDIALHFWLVDQKLEYALNFQTIINTLSIIPNLLGQDYMMCPSQSKIATGIDFLAYFGCGLTTLRLLRPMRIHMKLKEATDDVQRYIGGMGLTIVLMIVFNSGAMQFLERDDNALQFHVWMYWSIVTTSTVGYGDISPLSTVGRIACMIMISIGIVLVPKMTNDLIRIVESSSVYARAEYVGKAYTKHVVICGDMSSIPLAEFFEELFHEDHDAANLEAVVLLPSKSKYCVNIV